MPQFRAKFCIFANDIFTRAPAPERPLKITTPMRKRTYNSKIGWWVPAVVVLSIACCYIGPLFTGDFTTGTILCAITLIIEIPVFSGIKYKISGSGLWVRNLYRWRRYPIDKIAVVKKTHIVLNAAALSFDRVSITFTDRSILKSYMPLEISPAERDEFIAHLKEINPLIKVSH